MFQMIASEQLLYSQPSAAPTLKNQYNCGCSSVGLNGVAALFHAIQAVVILGLVSWLNTQDPNISKSGIFPLDITISVWHKKLPANNNSAGIPNATWLLGDDSNHMMISDDFYIEYKKISSGELDVRYVIVAFFMLSAIFQAIGGYVLAGTWGCRLRLVEYSVSASIMVMAIAVESGIRDFYTLAMMFVLTWVTMILGLLADFINAITVVNRQLEWDPVLEIFGPWSWLVPHIAGWVTFLAAYGPILDVFIQSSSKSDVEAPGFVHVIVFLQFVFFSSFGFVQLYSLVRRTNLIIENIRSGGRKYSAVMGEDMYSGALPQQDHNIFRDLGNLNDTVERAYITLSFVAKTILGWLILSPILVNAIK